MTLQIQNTSTSSVIIAGLNGLQIAGSATVSAPFYAPYTSAQIKDAISSFPTLSFIAGNNDFQIENIGADPVVVTGLNNLSVVAYTTVVVPASTTPYTQQQILDAVSAFPFIEVLGTTEEALPVPTGEDGASSFNQLEIKSLVVDANEILADIQANVAALQASGGALGAYTPIHPTYFAGAAPTNIQGALDRLVTAVYILQGNTPLA